MVPIANSCQTRLLKLIPIEPGLPDDGSLAGRCSIVAKLGELKKFSWTQEPGICSIGFIRWIGLLGWIGSMKSLEGKDRYDG